MAQQSIVTVLANAQALFAAVKAIGVPPVLDNELISAINECNAVATGERQPTTATAHRVGAMLDDLQRQGVVTGIAIQSLSVSLVVFATALAAATAGQAAVIDADATFNGISGQYLFVPKDGPAAAAIATAAKPVDAPVEVQPEPPVSAEPAPTVSSET